MCVYSLACVVAVIEGVIGFAPSMNGLFVCLVWPAGVSFSWLTLTDRWAPNHVPSLV
jgi:hypothetical protein